MTLIIDGYNIIGAWPDFASRLNLADSRERLIAILCDYAGYTGDKVILVFDAYAGDNPKRSIEEVTGIQVVYTRSGETADHYIERLVDELCSKPSKQIEVRVATSDLIEQTIVLGRGAARISSPELRQLVMQRRQTGRQAHPPAPKNTLHAHLPKDVLEKLERMRKAND